MATETADISPQAPISPDTTSAVLPSSGNEGASAPAPSAPPQQNDNIRQLREAYEGIKSKYEPWDKLGLKPEDVQRQSGVYQRVYTEVAQLGRGLGFPDDEIEEALAADPVRALDYLRELNFLREQQQPDEQDGDLNSRIQQQIDEALTPIQQWKQQEEDRANVRATDEANALFERTVHQLAAEQFKKEGIDYAALSEDEKYFITTGVSEVLKYNEQGLRDLKYGGKTAAVQAAFHEFFQLADKYYLARQERGRARIAPARGAAPTAPKDESFKLDDFINDPQNVDRALGRTGANAKYK